MATMLGERLQSQRTHCLHSESKSKVGLLLQLDDRVELTVALEWGDALGEPSHVGGSSPCEYTLEVDLSCVGNCTIVGTQRSVRAASDLISAVLL